MLGCARDRPGLVEQVITLGSPINGVRPTSPSGATGDLRRETIDRADRARQLRPIRVPVTTVYSRRDGVVHWRQAIDEHTPSAVNIEVDSSHIGLGIDPDVWRVIADAIDDHSVPSARNRHRRR